MKQIQYVIYMFMTFIPWTTSEDCSCNEFINSYGFGQCKRIHPKHGHICYVKKPSNCDDLMESMSNPEMLISASACNSEAVAGGGVGDPAARKTGAGAVAGGGSVAPTGTEAERSCTDRNGKRQEDGSTWLAADRCNHCKCSNGKKSCSKMACKAESNPGAVVGGGAVPSIGTGAGPVAVGGPGVTTGTGAGAVAGGGAVPATGTVAGTGFVGGAPFPTGTGEGAVAGGLAVATTGTGAAAAPPDIQSGSVPLQNTDTTSQKACCGRKKYKSSRGRIVHGQNVDMNEYPWIARLQMKSARGVLYQCGGSLIASEWILTAHHCLRSNSDPNSVTVILGDHTKSTMGESDMEKGFQVSKIINYGEKFNWNWDISLLKLSQPVDMHIYTPVCLPEYTTENKYIGKTAWVVGWGALAAGGSMADILQKARLQIVSNKECKEAMKDGKTGIDIVSTMICAGSTGGGLVKDSCQGDSGGPLAYSNDGIYEEVGIVSQGSGCALPGLFGVYAYVAPMKEWIQKTMQSNGGESLPAHCKL